MSIHVLERADIETKEWERVVYAEVLIPDTPNVFGDYWTEAAVREAMYKFMIKGFGIDVEHDERNIFLDGKAVLVESFIVRDGDKDFIKGSWVVGMMILDDELWSKVLSGEINGFSYKASVYGVEATYIVEDDGMRYGVTEPDPIDGHVHEFAVCVDEDNRPLWGGTSEELGHSHEITSHTVTSKANDHVHRFNLLKGGSNAQEN